MPEINHAEFQDLTASIEHSAIHLETRDAYGTETELPHMAKWAAGEPDDLDWLEGWCAKVRGHVANGRTLRRAKIVSEPLSEYQRWAHTVIQPMVDAGEDIRWVPRRRVSSIAFPGNDFYLLDGKLIIFLHYAGSGLNIALTTSTDPADIALCRRSFESAWSLAVPHSDYQPE